jgi:hypothetical protein
MNVVVPPPLPFKDRRPWLVAFGVAEILIGCLVLLLMALAIFATRSLPVNPATPAGGKGILVVGVVFYAVIALLFVSIGIGSIQARRWARIAMLIVGWAWLTMGVLTTAIMALVMPMILSNAEQQSGRPMPPGTDMMVRIVMFSMIGVFAILLPLVFVLFYSGKNVKATCESSTSSSTATKPVPVLIASGYFALGVLGYLFVLARPAFPVLGVVMSGWAAILAALLMEALTIWLAWNLYRQRNLAWKVAVGWVVFGWASTLATIARFGLTGMYRAMGYADAELVHIISFVKYGIYGGFLLSAVFLAFLVAVRKHFRASGAVVVG